MDDGNILKEKVFELATKILVKHPTMPTLLREIHTTLKANPEQVTLLSEEDINIIVSGLEIQTNTFLITATTSGSKATKSVAAKIKSGGLEAFGG